MKNHFLNSTVFVFILVLLSCNTRQEKSNLELNTGQGENILSAMSKENLEGLQWMNAPGTFKIENGILRVVAVEGTDFFNNPEDKSGVGTAPLLYKEITGDFVARALVRPDFSSLWNAVALMVYIDESNWIKFAFENSDATGKSIVSVVTKTFSDDANGVILNEPEMIWLKMIRKNNIYAMHWSVDGVNYKMARLSAMPEVESVKIGIEAQCPVGTSATHEILFFEVVEKTVEDLRKGK